MENIDPELLILIEEYLKSSINEKDLYEKIITILAITIPAIISLLVIFSQNSFNLKLKKIDSLTKSKEELRLVRNEIINYTIPTNQDQILSQEQYGSKMIDAAVARMRNIMGVSEYFTEEFGIELASNYESVQRLIGLSKQGKNIDEKEAIATIKKIQIFEPKMVNALNNSIRELQTEIDHLVKK